MTRKKGDELPIFVAWMDFVKWLFPVTEKLPRRVRFSLADRMNNLCLDVVEDLVEARYARKKGLGERGQVNNTPTIKNRRLSL